MADSPWVVEVTMENFQEVVVDGSNERPVVIDFWAPWCGPCRRLAPMLEQHAIQRAGGFLLAKVNTDENPDLAQAFQVEGIPAVYAVRDGKMVNSFTGVIPEEQLNEFLDSLGPATPPTPKEPTPVDRAQVLEESDPKAAAQAYRALFADTPTDPAVRVGLARVLLNTPGNEAEATSLLTGVDFGDLADEAKRLSTLVQLRTLPKVESGATEQGTTVAEKQLASAMALTARGEYTAALDALLLAAEDDQQLGRTAVRELMLKIFEVIGAQSEQAGDYRRRLQALLY